MSGAEAIGVDLGGTKMLVGVVDDEGTVLHRRVGVAAGLGEEELLGLLESELRIALEARPGARTIGLGVPCTIDRDRGTCVAAANLPLHDQPLRADFTERMGMPVFVDNDANAAVIAEHRRGAAAGATNVVMLTLGTGIGGGLIIDGRPYRGSSGAGAELGHVVVDIDGPRCQGNCPNRGCIEALASGTALAREAAEAAEREPESRLGEAVAEGRVPDGRLVTELARAGDPVSAGLLELIGRRLGAALSGLANSFDPDVIVIGGGVMAAGELILAPAREELRARALRPQNETPVRSAAFGPDAGMVGAAIMAAEELAAAGGAA